MRIILCLVLLTIASGAISAEQPYESIINVVEDAPKNFDVNDPSQLRYLVRFRSAVHWAIETSIDDLASVLNRHYKGESGAVAFVEVRKILAEYQSKDEPKPLTGIHGIQSGKYQLPEKAPQNTGTAANAFAPDTQSKAAREELLRKFIFDWDMRLVFPAWRSDPQRVRQRLEYLMNVTRRYHTASNRPAIKDPRFFDSCSEALRHASWTHDPRAELILLEEKNRMLNDLRLEELAGADGAPATIKETDTYKETAEFIDDLISLNKTVVKDGVVAGLISRNGDKDALISEYVSNQEEATKLCTDAIQLLSRNYKSLAPNSPERTSLEAIANTICDSYDKFFTTVDVGKEALGITDHYTNTGRMSPRPGWLEGKK